MFVDLAAGTGGNRVSFPGAPADTLLLLGFEGVIGSTLDDVVVGNVFRNPACRVAAAAMSSTAPTVPITCWAKPGTTC